MRRFLVLLAASMGFTTPLTTDAATPDDIENCEACEAVMDLALANPRRDGDRAHDHWRHPAETIAFFRIRPGMSVVDYRPSTGWWTRILVPYLGSDGHYIGLYSDVRSDSDSQRNVTGILPVSFAQGGGVPGARVAAYDIERVPQGLEGAADRVMLMRELHNIVHSGRLHREVATIRAMLKPDGMLGIVQHRARPDAADTYADGSKGYMREKDVIAMIEGHGFKLVGKSEVNANPGDPANHPAGAGSLPPSFAQGDEDRARYAAIGESDRMTLLFRKQP